MSEILIFLFAFALLLVLGAAFINGVYIVTRGDREERPDGSVVDVDDMIFYGFYKMIMKEKRAKEVVYFTGPRLMALYKQFLKLAPLPPADVVAGDHLEFRSKPEDVAAQILLTSEGDYPILESAVTLWRDYGPDVASKLEVHMVIENSRISFYKTYKQYRYSKYIRKPLVECLKCMASFWGTVFFWPNAMVLSHYFIGSAFHWVMIPIWVMYCFMLAYVNTYLFYKAK
jgi:hypothetical protein